MLVWYIEGPLLMWYDIFTIFKAGAATPSSIILLIIRNALQISVLDFGEDMYVYS